MTLHALLSATETTEDGETLRAAQMVAGQYLIERQAALCRDAGVSLTFVCVESMTDELVKAFDRLRSIGLAVEPVRRASEILDRTRPRDPLMLVLDGLYANGEQISAFAAGSAQAVFVTADTPVTRGLERIDADLRWAGLAMVRCDLLTDLADLPDDWDLSSTLLRRAVQRGAARLSCDPALFERGDLIVVDGDAAAEALSARVYDSAAVGESGMVMANVLAPLARLAGPGLLSHGARSVALDGVAMLLLIAAVAAWATGWIAAGAVAGLIGLLFVALARYVALFTLEPARFEWRRSLLTWLPITGIVALAANFALSVRPDWPVAISALVLATTLIHAQALGKAPQSSWFHRIVPDAGLAFTICGLGAGIGHAPLGTAIAALVAAALLATGAVANHPNRSTGFIPN